MSSEPSPSLPFDLVYLRPAEALPDSTKFRVRMAAVLMSLIDSTPGSTDSVFASLVPYLRREAGIDLLANVANYYGGWHDFCATAPIADLLTSITHIERWLSAQSSTRIGMNNLVRPAPSHNWIAHLRRAMEETSLAYFLTPEGGARKRVDSQFVGATQATIRSLNATRYSNSSADLQRAINEVFRVGGSYKVALTGVFQVAEGISKRLTGAATLGVAEAKRDIAAISARHQTNPRAVDASKLLCDSLAAWTTAMQQYRHDPQPEDGGQPSEMLAIALFDQGLTWIRFLVDLDRKENP